jgi:hypothetical protein
MRADRVGLFHDKEPQEGRMLGMQELRRMQEEVNMYIRGIPSGR